jgi:hypothetical protein
VFAAHKANCLREDQNLLILNIFEHREGLVAHKIANVPEFNDCLLIDRVHDWPIFKHAQQAHVIFVSLKDSLLSEVQVIGKFE